MSRPPGPRLSQASNLGPPPPANYPQPLRGSSIFAPQPGAQGMELSQPPSQAPSRVPSRVEPPPLSATMGPMPGTYERPIHGPKKRLIVTCDGTWLNQDNGVANGQTNPPSNVARMGWAIKDTSRDGIPQVVHYQAGVGTQGGRLSKILGGATGSGLKENMREAYTYLAINWRAGDEIFLIGFSRGAFTARSIGGLIGQMGLLTRTGLPYFNEIFEDVEHRYNDRYRSPSPDIPFPDHGPFDNTYLETLVNKGMTRKDVPIKAICCFDTVGSLGVPRVGWIRMGTDKLNDYQFYDTRLHPCVENAFQALALDEHRAPFSPAVWEKGSNDATNLKQVWFPGVHSNIGGGYNDQELANLTLAWMMSRLEPFLDFRTDYLMSVYEANRQYYHQTGQKRRWWSFGLLKNSFIGVFALAGSKTRTPGNYYRVDPLNNRPTDKKLRNTNEYIHASVRARVGLGGPGTEDKGIYDPPALRGWEFEMTQAPPGQLGNIEEAGAMIVWKDKSGKQKGGQDTIPEAILMESELTLLRQSAKVETFIRSMQLPTRDKRRSKRQDQNGYAANGGPPYEPTMAGAIPPGRTPPPPQQQAPGNGYPSGPPPGNGFPNGPPPGPAPQQHRHRRRHRDSGGQSRRNRGDDY